MSDIAALMETFRTEQLVTFAHLRACAASLQSADEALTEVLDLAERAEFIGPGVGLFAGLLTDTRLLRAALAGVCEESQRRVAAALADAAQRPGREGGAE